MSGWVWVSLGSVSLAGVVAALGGNWSSVLLAVLCNVWIGVAVEGGAGE